MENDDTIRRAVETINELLAAHVTDGQSDVTVYEAMAVRDELVAMDLSNYDMPEVGDIMYDPEHERRYGDGDVRVVEVTDTRSDEYYINDERKYQSSRRCTGGWSKVYRWF